MNNGKMDMKVRDFLHGGFLDNTCGFMLVSVLWVSEKEILSKLEHNLKRIGQLVRGNFPVGIVLVD